MVWYCAERVYPGKCFTGYTVLGDDVIITDDLVAKEYAYAMDQLQVKISLQKSLVSHSGCGEFAKKFRVRNLTEYLSPISIPACLSCHHPYGVMAIDDRYSLKRFSTACRLLGKSFKAIGRLPSNAPQWDDCDGISKSLKRLSIVFLKRRYSFKPSGLSWWFGRGLPLHPYIRGRLLSLLWDKLKPKDIRPAPSMYYVYYKVQQFDEYSVLRNWMSQWFNYLYWYWAVLYNYQCTLEEAVQGPQIIRQFYRTNTDESLVRFGYLFQLFHLVPSFYSIIDNGWALCPPSRIVIVEGICYLQGGFNGSDYLVVADGCQPSGTDHVSQLSSDNSRSFASLFQFDDDFETT